MKTMNSDNIQVTKFVNNISFIDSHNEKHVINNAEAFQFYIKKNHYSLIYLTRKWF